MIKILLVEDNEMNRDMLSRRLVRKGFEVDIAVDGQIAIEKAHSNEPDIILMDLSLPVIDGWEATRRIKANPDTQQIPVMALTAHDTAEDEKKARETGKKLENLRVKICIQGCQLNFGQCLDKILEGKRPGDPIPEGQAEIDACKLQFKNCSSECLELKS